MEFSQGIHRDKAFTPEDAEHSIMMLTAEVGQMVLRHIIEHGTMTVAVRTEMLEHKGGHVLRLHAIARPWDDK